MPDVPPLYARKVLGSLKPTNRACEEALAALDDGVVRIRITRTRGNVKRNALYWAILGVSAPMLSEKIDGAALSVSMLHDILKTKAGKFRPIKLPSGEVYRDLESISFAKMPENERSEYVSWAIQTLAKWLSCSEADLRHAGEAEGS